MNYSIMLGQIIYKKGLSLAKVSKLTGISISTLYRIEHGKVSPRFDTLIIISKALEVEPFEIIKKV